MKLTKLLLLPILMSAFSLSGCSCSCSVSEDTSSSTSSTTPAPSYEEYKVSEDTFNSEFVNYGFIGLDRSLKMTGTIKTFVGETCYDYIVTFECNDGVYRFRAYVGSMTAENLQAENFVVVDKASVTSDHKANVTTYVKNGEGYYKSDYVDVVYQNYIVELVSVLPVPYENYSFIVDGKRYETSQEVDIHIGMGEITMVKSIVAFLNNKMTYFKSESHTKNDTTNRSTCEYTSFEVDIPAIDIPTNIIA